MCFHVHVHLFCTLLISVLTDQKASLFMVKDQKLIKTISQVPILICMNQNNKSDSDLCLQFVNISLKVATACFHIQHFNIFVFRPNCDDWKRTRKYNKQLEKLLAQNNLR